MVFILQINLWKFVFAEKLLFVFTALPWEFIFCFERLTGFLPITIVFPANLTGIDASHCSGSKISIFSCFIMEPISEIGFYLFVDCREVPWTRIYLD